MAVQINKELTMKGPGNEFVIGGLSLKAGSLLRGFTVLSKVNSIEEILNSPQNGAKSGILREIKLPLIETTVIVF